MSRVRHQNIEINKGTNLNNANQIYFHAMCLSYKGNIRPYIKNDT